MSHKRVKEVCRHTDIQPGRKLRLYFFCGDVRGKGLIDLRERGRGDAGSGGAGVAMLQEARRKIARLSGSVDNPRQYILGARPPGQGVPPYPAEKKQAFSHQGRIAVDKNP